MPWAARAASHRWAALAVVLTGTFMVVLDFFIVNVAMPAMQADLHAGTGAIEWVIAGYGLTFATFLITAGRLGDQLGRRRMFSLGLALFTLASAACGLAPSPAVLVGARLVQGLAAALLSPQVLSIIGVVYEGPDRVRAISIYGIVLGLAAVGGQLIGGVLVQADIAGLGWRSCFLINVPVGLAALVVAARAVPESRAEAPIASTSWAPRWSRSGWSTSSCRSSRAASTAGPRGRGCASAPPRSPSASSPPTSGA
jgi:MFS family permease